MLSKRFMVCLLAVLPPAAALADPLPVEVRYDCDRGSQVRAIYLKGAAMAVLDVEGQLVALESLPAASGTFYSNGRAEMGYRWHTKGDAAFLSYQTEGDPDETVLLHNCVATP